MTSANRIVRYAITNLTDAAPGHAGTRLELWRARLHHWLEGGVSFVQLREKPLPVAELLQLAEAGMALLHQEAAHPPPRLLVNGRADVAVAARADGVHLTAAPGELTPDQVRRLFATAGLARPTVSISCHTASEVASARETGADLILFGPVFGKRLGDGSSLAGSGLDALRDAVAAAGSVPVLALGGITAETAPVCLAQGAAGIAGIRCFDEEASTRTRVPGHRPGMPACGKIEV